MSQATRTTLNRTWLIKMAIFFAFLAGLGVWGYYDATVKWPQRGVRHAEWSQWQYLSIAVNIGQASRSSVPDPVEEFTRLSEPTKLAQIQASESSTAGSNEMDRLELTRYRWLKSLSRVGRLDPQYTLMDDPRDIFRDLDDKWKSSSSPKPLAAYDIMMQWVIAFSGFAGAAFMIALFANVARQRYTFDYDALTLTLPDGTTIKPTDIDVFDKRKWHRFIVFLKLTQSHDKLGGKELRLDLLRYSPLETWVKQMFKEAHPDEYRESFPDEFAEPSSAESASESSDESPDESTGESSGIKSSDAEQDGSTDSEQGAKADPSVQGD